MVCDDSAEAETGQATTEASSVGPGDPGSNHEIFEHDIVKDINEEVGPEAVGKLAEEAFHLTEPIGTIVSGVLGMKSDQPDPEEH